jgi:hypothetical protein
VLETKIVITNELMINVHTLMGCGTAAVAAKLQAASHAI